VKITFANIVLVIVTMTALGISASFLASRRINRNLINP